MISRIVLLLCTAIVIVCSCCSGDLFFRQNDNDLTVIDSIAYLLHLGASQPDSMASQSLEYLERALFLARQKNIKKGMLFEMYYHLGIQSEKTGNYDLAASYFREAINHSNRNHLANTANAYNYVGQIALRQGKYDIAMEFFPKALNIHMQSRDSAGIASSFRNIGAAYQLGGYFEQAQRRYEESMEIYALLKNQTGIADCLNNLGGLRLENNQPQLALEYYLESKRIFTENNNSEQLWNVYYNIGSTHNLMNEIQQALEYYYKMLQLSRFSNSPSKLSETYLIMGTFFNEINQHDSALIYYDKSIEISSSKGLYGTMYVALSERSRLHAASGRHSEAFADMVAYAFAYDEIYNRNTIRAFTEKSMQYEFDMQQQQQLFLNHIQRIIIFSLSLVAALVGIIGIVSYRNYIQKKKANYMLAEKNNLLKHQKEEITDSIRYASMIQKATLPAKEYSDSVLPEHFIYNRPRDIVSGDFYWIDRRDDHIIVAAADCTGHGVPGAIVSMLGISALAKVAGKMKSPKPDVILNALRKDIIHLLNPVGSTDSRQDGMDLALVIIHTNTKEMEYSGAYNPLYLIRKEQLIEKKANRMPIGLHVKNEEAFTSERFYYQTGDVIYLFSDGYADQFGGANEGKFKTKNFKKLLLEINSYPMEEQARILDATHLKWRGENPQIDDILVIGIRL